MKNFFLSIMLMLYAFTNAQITIYEDFERYNLPGYGMSIYGWSGILPGSTSCSGTKAYKCLIGSFLTPTSTLIYTTNHSNGTELKYSFKYFVESMTNYSSGGIITTSYSLDGGTTWIDLGSPITFLVPVAGAAIPCTLVSGTIPAGTIPTGSEFKFRVMVKNTVALNSAYQTVGIDDIQLEQTPTEIPSCLNTQVYFTTPTEPLRTDIQWYPAKGATGYYISLGTTPGGTDVINNLDIGNSTHYFISSLHHSTQYFVTITPYNSFGNASCTIASGFVTRKLLCPADLFPSGQLASAISQFAWSPVPDAAGYRITAGTTPQTNDILNNVDLGNVTSFKPSAPFYFNTAYNFTVKAYNASGESIGCATGFKTQMPCAPLMFHWPNGNVVSSLTPTLAWGTKDFVHPTGGFKLSLGKYTGPNSTNNVLDNFDVGYVSSYQLTTPLAPGTTYFYRVVGYNYQSEQFNNACHMVLFTTPGGVLGTSEMQKDNDGIIIYPNPTKDFIMINSKKKINNINIADFAGRKLKELTFKNDKIDLNDLSKGNYILQIQFTDNTVYNKTITKE